MASRFNYRRCAPFGPRPPPFHYRALVNHDLADLELVDTGDLGLSIVTGLERHLRPDGVALLFYNSFFYHEVVVKIATHLGLDVRHHAAPGITAWELQSLFEEYRTSGAKIIEEPHDCSWGMREMIVEDPDGNTFRMGCLIEQQT